MARAQEFYKGKRKRRNYAFVPFIVLLALFSVMLVLFYGMQKYAVISKDGVKIELPILMEGKGVTVDSEGHAIRSFEPVSVPLVFDEADYSYVKSHAGKNAPPVRAIFASCGGQCPRAGDEAPQRRVSLAVPFPDGHGLLPHPGDGADRRDAGDD